MPAKQLGITILIKCTIKVKKGTGDGSLFPEKENEKENGVVK